MSAHKTVGELLQDALDRLGERLEALEEGWAALTVCQECHHLFSDRDDYAQHLCSGSQGR